MLVAASKAASAVPDISIGHAFFQMVIALVVIGGCAWGGTKVLARVRGGNAARTRPGATSGLTVLSRQPLGKGLQIAVVRWGEREVLVGISGTTITFLSDPRAEEAPTAAAEATQGMEFTGFPSFVAPQPTIAPYAMPIARHASSPTAGVRRPFLESLRDATTRR